MILLQTPIVPEIRPLEFHGLNGTHLIWLVVIVNVFYFVYRTYKTYVESKKFSSIYAFIEQQNRINSNWDKYVKNLQDKLIREAPADQIKVVVKSLLKNDIDVIAAQTKKLIELNGIKNKELTRERIKTFVTNIFNETRADLDLFLFDGRRVSAFLCKSWNTRMCDIVEGTVYGSQDIGQLYRQLEEVRKQIMYDFYKRMIDDEDDGDK